MALWQRFVDVLESCGLAFEQVRHSSNRSAFFALAGFADPFDVAVLETEWARRVESEHRNATAMPRDPKVASAIQELRIQGATLVSSHRSRNFRLVDKIGYLGSCPEEYFEYCRELDELRVSEGFTHSEYTPLLCAVGGAGQGKTQLCYEILRQIDAKGAPNVCAVMLPLGEGFDWKQWKYREWDEEGVGRGLWARIGLRMGIPNWEAFKPDTVHQVYAMLHAIAKQRCSDAAETEVHLLVDGALKIDDEAERGQLLDGISMAVQSSISTRKGQKSYALVTSLRAEPIRNCLFVAGSGRKPRYLPLSAPVPFHQEVAMALRLHVICGILETLFAESVPNIQAICIGIQQDLFGSSGLQQGPEASKIAVINGVLDGLTRSGAAKATADWLPTFVAELFDVVKLSADHAVYGSSTWRSMEELFIRRESYFRAFYVVNKENEPNVRTTVPQLLHRAPALYNEGPKAAEDLKVCVQQLMRLTEGWVTINSNMFEYQLVPFVVQEASVSNLLIRGTMWAYWRDAENSLRTIPFVTLRFLITAEDDSKLDPAERSFHSTYKELANELPVRSVDDVPRAFERAAIRAMGLRLLALNQSSLSTHGRSATLEDLFPFAIFSSDSTKELRLRQRLLGQALAMPTLEDVLKRKVPKTDTTMELLKLPQAPDLLCVTGGRGCAEGIDGVMWFRDDDDQSVLCVYSMKLREGKHAADAFAAVFELLASSAIPVPDRICVMVASVEDVGKRFDFPTPPRLSSSEVECILLNHKALDVLLGPFGASFLLT